MKFGIYTSYWENNWGSDPYDYIDHVAGLGFDLVELPAAYFYDQEDDYFKKIKDQAAAHEIDLSAGYGPSPDHNIASKDDQVQKKAFHFYEVLFRQMDLAGIRQIGGALYSYWPVNYDQEIDKEDDFTRSVEAMKNLADMAGEYNINLNMEALNRFEGYLINTSQECVNYVRAVDKENVKVMLDTFHMNIEEDSLVEAIRHAGDLLGELHVGEANRKPPRPGRMPWQEIGQVLKEIKYEGPVVMEPFVMQGGQVGKDICVWRDLFDDTSREALNQEAKASLHFLRQSFQ